MASLVLTAATLGGTTAITPTDQAGVVTLTLPTTTGTLTATNASGNLGIGTTPSAWGAGTSVIDLNTAGGAGALSSSGTLSIASNGYFNGTNWIYKNSSYAQLYQMISGKHSWQIAPVGTAGNAITFTQAMTLDTSGNLGVGQTSPSYRLDVVNATGAGATTSIRLNNPGTAVGDGPQILFTSGSSTTGGCAIAGYGTALNAASMLFYSGGNTETMRLDSSQNLLVGTTSTSYNEKFGVNQASSTSGNYAGFFNNANGSTNNGIRITIGTAGNNTSTWHFAGVTAGIGGYYLYGNGTSSYSSDERLKKNIQSTRDGYLEDVCKLRVVKYQWLGDDQDCQQVELGLIAQEVETVFPRLIQEHEIEGVGIRKNVKQSVLPFILLKSIQELSALVTAQSATITSLTERITALEGK
jgi:hypothetical protein